MGIQPCSAAERIGENKVVSGLSYAQMQTQKFGLFNMVVSDGSELSACVVGVK